LIPAAGALIIQSACGDMLTSDTLESRTLYRAAEKLRGVPALAAALSVPEAKLRRWMAGESPPPEAVFRASMEIFLGARRPRPKPLSVNRKFPF
jgi:hypothetical protein